MTPCRVALVAGGLALIVGTAAAAADDSAPVSTASNTSSTDAQIAAWLKDAPPVEKIHGGAGPDFQRDDPPIVRDRAIHGEVGAAIGSDGYRSAYGVATVPIGSNASATVAVSAGRGPWFGGYGAYGAYGPYAPYGYGPYAGGPWSVGPVPSWEAPVAWGAGQGPWSGAWRSGPTVSATPNGCGCPTGGPPQAGPCPASGPQAQPPAAPPCGSP